MTPDQKMCILLAVVEEHFDERNIFRSSRKRKVAYPRQMFHYVAYKKLRATTHAIGAFSKRDHATVIYSCKQIRNWMEMEKGVRADYEAIRSAVEVKLRKRTKFRSIYELTKKYIIDLNNLVRL